MHLSIRFWLESALAVVSGALVLLTLTATTWIETLFHLDPDRGSGSLEWLIVGSALVVTVASVTMAGREWRRRDLPSAWSA